MSVAGTAPIELETTIARAAGAVNTLVPPTIHVIEPDPAVAQGLRSLFVSHDYAVEVYANASAFLARGAVLGPGCVIAEHALPDGSALSLIEQIAARGEPLAVIVIAARSDVSSAVEAMRAGAFDFLEKPFAQTRLLERAAEAIQATTPERH